MKQEIKLQLFLNPVAGKGQARKSYHQLVSLLKKKRIAYQTTISKKPQEFIALARDYANQKRDPNEFLIVIGGDGSLNEVLNGVKHSAHPDTPFTYLPSGTGNDFARAAGLTKNIPQLVRKLLTKPTIQKIDCGSYQEVGKTQIHYFVNNLGIGFDGNLVHQSNAATLKARLNKINLGNLIYAINGFRALASQDTFAVTVKSKDRAVRYGDAYFATTTNHPYFGGGIAIMPKANLQSHKLDTVIVEKRSLLKFLLLFGKVFTNGSHVYDPAFHYVEADEIEVKTHKPELAQLDGEDLPKKPYHLKFKVDHFYLIK